MAERNVTQEELAGSSGVNRATISQILNSRTDARERTLKALSKSLNWPLPGGDVPMLVGDPKVTPSVHVGGRQVRERGPRPGGSILGGPSRASESAQMIAQAVAAVIEQVIQQNEMHGTREGVESLATSLIAFATTAEASGADVSKLLLLAIKLREGSL